MTPRFSIIIPVYNAEEHLRECLDSILAQTETDFECLMIDDGSTDGSGSMLEAMAAEDSRFMVFHQQNRGVSAARNVGLDHAQGEFVCFVDADDTVAATYLADLHEAMGEKADSAMCGFHVSGTRDAQAYTVVPDCKKIETLEETLKEFYDFQQPYWQHYLWNRMLRREVIETQKLRFRDGIYYKEDGLFVVQYLCRSNGLVGCSDRVVYYYRTGSKGAIANIDHRFDLRLMTNLKAHQLIIQELRTSTVANEIIAIAQRQAKSVASWIVTSILKDSRKNIYRLPQVETMMLEMLGIGQYIRWHLSQIKNQWK